MTANIGALPVISMRPTQCFSVIAVTDPSSLPRTLEIFAKLTLVPVQCHVSQVGVTGGELHIDLQFADMDSCTADHLARALRSIYLVKSVLTSEKRHRLTA